MKILHHLQLTRTILKPGVFQESIFLDRGLSYELFPNLKNYGFEGRCSLTVVSAIGAK